MVSTSPSESAIIRRVAASRKLEKQIPRINLVSIIIRVAQFLTLCGFTLAYAMSQPPVYLDIFVWPQNTAPPYEMTVYRDTTSYGGIWAERFSVDSPNYSAVAFLWNHSLPPAGLSETHVCTHGPRWGCDGTQWAATRIGWSDSWPFGTSLEVEAPGMTYIDRYIFWLLVVGGYLGSGHNVVVMAHALEPSGVGFYKYIAIMDFIISAVFLLLGIFPIAKQQYLSTIVRREQGAFGTSPLSRFGLFTSVLDLNEQYAFCLGWTLWALYTVTFLLSVILVRNLERYESLPKTLPSTAVGNSSSSVARPTTSSRRARPEGAATTLVVPKRCTGPTGTGRN